MNVYKKFKIIYWASAGCASRSICGFLGRISNDTGLSYNRDTGEYSQLTACGHTPVVPPDYQDWPIVCAMKNPYPLVVSSFIDIHAAEPHVTFEEYVKEHDFFGIPYEQWKKTPDYFIRIESLKSDLESIPQLREGVSDDLWNESMDNSIVTNHHANENQLDEYNSNGVQRTDKWYNQELADIVYEREKFIFDLCGYDKDSWKV